MYFYFKWVCSLKQKPDYDFCTGCSMNRNLELTLLLYAMHWQGFLRIFVFPETNVCGLLKSCNDIVIMNGHQ